jgi:beta-mannosidase
MIGVYILTLLLISCFGTALTTHSVSYWQTVQPVQGSTSIVQPLFGLPTSRWIFGYCDELDCLVSRRNWTAIVPGDLWSDLVRSKLIQDPYYQRNLYEQRRVWMGALISTTSNSSYWEERSRTWSYTTQVVVNRKIQSDCYTLIFNGVQMGAHVHWNGVLLTDILSQFRRHIVTIPSERVREHNTLQVIFQPGLGGRQLRFMACSGGWDWAPYSRAVSLPPNDEAHWQGMGNLGIVQPLYLIQSTYPYLLTHLQPLVYPATSTTTNNNIINPEFFVVKVYVTLQYTNKSATPIEDSTPPIYVCASLSINHTSAFCQEVKHLDVVRRDSNHMYALLHEWKIAQSTIELWWPRIMGSQSLYLITGYLSTSPNGTLTNSSCIQCMERTFGFRTIAMITTSDNTLIDTNSSGSGLHGMRYEINGEYMWTRGANVVPMDLLPHRWSDEGHAKLVQSAARANMNMLRIWGGGALLPHTFYDECDRLGILIQQDLYFVEEQYHGALPDSSIIDEIADIVLSLSHHPSIIQWNGGNEVPYTQMKIYEDIVIPTVTIYDTTRIVWPTSPTEFGWESGVFTRNGLPNGQVFRVRQQSHDMPLHLIEAHGPYQRGYSLSHPAVNGIADPESFLITHIPPELSLNKSTGVREPNTFTSEFGATSYSSFESMSAYMYVEDWGIHGSTAPDTCHHLVGNVNACFGPNVWAERNYPCDSFIQTYFGNVSLDGRGPQALQQQLYQCMMSQTLWMKGEIEVLRSRNSFGLLIWQLNEIWPTGGWGLLEYGPNRYTHQHVVGGRWKPLMYLLYQSLYSDVWVACGQKFECILKNDCNDRVRISISAEVWRLPTTDDESHLMCQLSVPNSVVQGRGESLRFSVNCPGVMDDAHVILIQVRDDHSKRLWVEDSVYLWKLPHELPASTAVVTATVVDANSTMAWIQVESSELVIYVWLSTLASGHFLSNSFAMRPYGSKWVQFVSLSDDEPIDVSLLRESLRVEHLQSYTHPIRSDLSTSRMQ